MTSDSATIEWLLASDEPWTRLRTRLDLLGQAEDDPAVVAERQALFNDDQILLLIALAMQWPGYALKRHNDARHPLYAISTMADFGLRTSDPGILPIAEKIVDRQDSRGALLSRLHLYKQFAGLEGEYDTWMLCDWPTLLYALLAFGMGGDPRVADSVAHLNSYCNQEGWPCAASSWLGDFKGPGKDDDPCPIANVYALKALSLVPDALDSPETRQGCEMLLEQWQEFARARALQAAGKVYKPRKLFLFGVGTDFHKLKYPFVWYDILHVAEVLSRFPFVRDDARFLELVSALTGQGDENDRYTATSMYRAWSGWSFANKKEPSPWLTFLVLRIQQRLGRAQKNQIGPVSRTGPI